MVKENQGDFQGAINLYLKAGLPTKAARLAMEQPEISSNSDSVSRIAGSLIKGEFYERVSGVFLFFSPPPSSSSSSSRRRLDLVCSPVFLSSSSSVCPACLCSSVCGCLTGCCPAAVCGHMTGEKVEKQRSEYISCKDP